MADYVDKGFKKIGMPISKPMLAAVCIISGIMVILFPSLLQWIVGLFLIVQGALVLTECLGREMPRTTTMTVTEGVRCRSCGTRNTDEAAYCITCGKKLVEATPLVTAQPQEVVQ